MRHCMIFLFILMVSLTYGQKKKDKSQSPPDNQAKIDTLTKANEALILENKNLTAKSDSLSKELETYYGLYAVIKDKVVMKDFDPARMSAIIDSLKAGRDSLTLKAASGVINADASVKQIKQVDSLISETQGLLYTVNLLRGKPAKSPASPQEFIGTWTLVMRKMKLTGQSPRTGLVDVTEDPVAKTATPLELNPVTQLTFIDSEFAEFTFRNGQKAKCYFVIEGFSPTKSYYIDFKGTKLDIRMYVMFTLLGPRVSFEVPGAQGLYYFGQMTQ
jgi:hypothetical protein